MKKIKFLCFYSLLFFSPAIFAETVVQPFADCKITRSKEEWQYDLKYSAGFSFEEWQYDLKYSAGFPFHESKLFLILRYGYLADALRSWVIIMTVTLSSLLSLWIIEYISAWE